MKTRINISLIENDIKACYTYDHFGRYVDEQYWLANIHEDDYPNIYKKHKVTMEEMQNAVDIIITWLIQQNNNRIIIDLDERNKRLAPAKEMTLEDVEKELGYKVKIVNKK